MAALDKIETQYVDKRSVTTAQSKQNTNLNVVKGNKKDKGKDKGDGECWHCG